MGKLKTLPKDQFEPEFIDKFELFFANMADRLDVKMWNGMNFTGKIVGSLISNLMESLNNNQMLELDFAWKQMIENEFIQLLKVQNNKIKDKFRDLDTKLPLSAYDLLTNLDHIKESIYEVMKEDICLKNYDKMIEIVNNLKDSYHTLCNDVIEKNNSMSQSHNSNLESNLHKKLTTLYTTHIVQEFNLNS
jgi:hypothetical protein